MIYAIQLTQIVDEDGGIVIYTNKIAAFEYEGDAREFACSKDDTALIDSDGRMLKEGIVQIPPEYFEGLKK